MPFQSWSLKLLEVAKMPLTRFLERIFHRIDRYLSSWALPSKENIEFAWTLSRWVLSLTLFLTFLSKQSIHIFMHVPMLQVLWTPCESCQSWPPMSFRLASPGDHTGQVSLEQLVEVRMRFRAGVRRYSFCNSKECWSLSNLKVHFRYSRISDEMISININIHQTLGIKSEYNRNSGSKRRRDVFHRRFPTGSTSRPRVSKPVASHGHWRGTETEISWPVTSIIPILTADLVAVVFFVRLFHLLLQAPIQWKQTFI